MVAITSRLDDVLLTTKGKKVDATHTVVRTVPATCSPTGKTTRVKMEVSDEGEQELAKLDEEYRKRLLHAGQVYLNVADKQAAMRAASKPLPKKAKSGSDHPAPIPFESPDTGDASDADADDDEEGDDLAQAQAS